MISVAGILKTFGETPDPNLYATAERMQQYKNIGLFDDSNGKGFSYAEAHVKAAEMYTKKIFESNSEIEFIADRVKIHGVHTNSESTKSMGLPDGTILIVADSHTQGFIWIMNKAFLYGYMQLTKEENIFLFRDVLLHFSSLALTSQKGAFPKPKTPPHSEKSGADLLFFQTEIMEVFLYSHEVAHALIHEKSYLDGKEHVLHADRDFLVEFGLDNLDELDDEFLADEIAFDLTQRAYNENDPDTAEIVGSTIFRLFTYFAQLKLVVSGDEDDPDYKAWSSRALFMMIKFRLFYRWGDFKSTGEMAEILKERLDVGAELARSELDIVREELGGRYK